MSQENVEIAKRVQTLLQAGDYDGALACFHPDVEWRILGMPPPKDAGRGIDSLRRLLVPGEDALFEIHLPPPDIEECVAVGDYVLTVVKVPFLDDDDETVEIGFYEFKDGKIISDVSGYGSKQEALDAIERESGGAAVQ